MSASWTAQAEASWPARDGLDGRDTVTECALLPGTVFDGATVPLLTPATRNRLRDGSPHGRLEVQRVRPNLVLGPGGGEPGVADEAGSWPILALGGEVRRRITGPCGRGVMTTCAQRGLPQETEMWRTAVPHPQGQVGAYAAVVRGGTMRRGDRVRLGD